MADPSREWLPAPSMIELPADEVHVWRFSLDADEDTLARLARLLDDDETKRAGRFKFAVHANRFVVRRGRLRMLLGDHLGIAPEAIRFAYGPQGKPRLADSETALSIHVNMSHSDDLALVALSHGRRLGIDAERVRPEMVAERIPEQFFSPREVESLRALPERDQVAAFFNCWTRKEAYIKALGLGLSLPLNSFDVSLAPGEPAALLATRPHADEARRWSMTALSPGDGFAGALVVEGSGWRLRCWDDES